jgi:pimeloyl-ACP methyl ester carboxylesterase
VNVIEGATSHRVVLRSIDFHYLEWGAALLPPMVLLHGLTGHARIWDHMAPSLSRRYRLFALDQRGHGDTSHTASYTTQEFVDDLEAMRQHWGIKRFVLMGLSMGGHNAMAYAAQHDPHVERLIIIDIPPAFDMQRVPDRGKMEDLARDGHRVFATLDDAVAAARGGNATAPDANLRYRTACNVREVPAGIIFKYDPKVPTTWQPDDLWPVVGSLAMPSLLVRGGLPGALPRSVADRMVAAFPRLELAEVMDSGHSVPTDKPEKLAPIVLEWLARTAPATTK